MRHTILPGNPRKQGGKEKKERLTEDEKKKEKRGRKIPNGENQFFWLN